MQLVIGQKKILGKQTVLGLIIEMLLLYYLPTYIAWLFLVLLAVFEGTRRRDDYNVFFKYSIAIMALGIMVGIFSLIFYQSGMWPFLRDIIRVSFLPLTIIWTQRKARDLNKDVYKAMFAFCGICVLVGMIRIIITDGFSLSLYESVRTFRQKLFISEYILAMGTFLFFFRRKLIGRVYISSVIDVIIGVICIIVFGMAFSRTALLLLVCMLVFQLKDIKKSLLIFVVICAVIALIVRFAPTLWDDFIVKLLRSSTELSQSNTWDSTNIVLNWRGYETYCARLQYASAGWIEKIFGIGYGRGIDARGYSYLVIDEPTIPWLHNGYYTFLVKQGIIGIALVVVFWIKTVLNTRIISNSFSRRYYLGLVVGLMISMMVASGIFWGNVPFVYFLAISEVFNTQKTREDYSDENINSYANF